jgi:ribosomal protein S18 acetylase RimI-like enzyme
MGATKHILPDRVGAVSATLTRAFAEDPVMHWIFDAAERPLDHLRQFMRITCERSIAVGHAYELGERAGAALWAPPGAKLFDEAAGIAVYSLLCGAIGETRAEKEPHFYLATIGIDPDQRGNGHGAQLMQRVLDICDEEKIVAYLESSNPRNVSLYERAGFEVVTETQLPEGPIMRPMVRQPNH